MVPMPKWSNALRRGARDPAPARCFTKTNGHFRPAGPIRHSHRQRLRADEHRPDADLRRAAHRQFCAWRIPDDRHVRRLGVYATVRAQSRTSPPIAIVPAMFLFGAIVYRLIISPALDKPHLVVVFATMALSIFLQNAALMAMTADLRDIPPIFADPSPIGPIHLKVELLLGFLITLLCTVALQWIIKQDLSRQGDPRHRAGRRSRDADGHPGAARSSSLPSPPARRWWARCLRDAAAVLGVSVGRAEFRPDRLRHRRAGRHGKHRRRAARRRLCRRGAVAERLLRRTGVRSAVLLRRCSCW